ncbi:DUF3298 and DUF4163 domain-containing protein [Prevotella sp. HUN102]|uniref:DUF3298 and DUF4163 domain-containing protein n=1 Tax=Prevotella sp. HUN102 TaxID=1392486 RepID=UPI0004910708|nr:DUF3298 and DUF4163 domain-containing protein [Prevotella sp. HUN102]
MNMKFLFCALFLMFSTMATDSCIAARQTVADDTIRVDSVEKIVMTDNAHAVVYVDYPVSGPAILRDSIEKYILNELSRGWDESVVLKPLPVSREAVGLRAKRIHASLDDMYKEFAASVDDPNEDYVKSMMYETDVMLRKVCETEDFVTYTNRYYEYLGGAHGITGMDGVTFLKPSGKLVGYVVDNLKLTELQPILRKGIVEYFQESEVEMTEEEIIESLFVEDGIIPLPFCKPYFTKGGLTFLYGQYEIGAYAIGMPNFVVPYETIFPYLTSEGKQIVSKILNRE